MAVLSFVAGQILQFWRARRHTETAVSKATSFLTIEIYNLVIERLKIRFEPDRIAGEGRTLRQYRTVAALDMLKEIKVSDLPIDAVEHFIKFRANVLALNEAMNTEKPDVLLPLKQYASIFLKISKSNLSLQDKLRKRAARGGQKDSWMPPDNYKPFSWREREQEKAAATAPQKSVES